MKKVISKGFTITATSWENDGDNYKTKSMTVESEDEAKAIVEMCKTIFKSCNNRDGGIGNTMDDEGESVKELIGEFMINHPVLIKDFLNENPGLIDGLDVEDIDETSLDSLVDICMRYNNQLMGGSEYYYSRVCERVDVTYSDKDIFSEEVNF
jgi:mevalonate kinase